MRRTTIVCDYDAGPAEQGEKFTESGLSGHVEDIVEPGRDPHSEILFRRATGNHHRDLCAEPLDQRPVSIHRPMLGRTIHRTRYDNRITGFIQAASG